MSTISIKNKAGQGGIQLEMFAPSREKSDRTVEKTIKRWIQEPAHAHSAKSAKADYVLVLGDSTPYSVYIPTHEYLARLGLAIGFSSWKVEELRTRGDKWQENPQRHKVKLKEVILTMTR